MTLPIFCRVAKFWHSVVQFFGTVYFSIIIFASCVSVIANSYTYDDGYEPCGYDKGAIGRNVARPPPVPRPNMPQTAFLRNFLFFYFFLGKIELGVVVLFSVLVHFLCFCGMVYCCVVEKSKIWAFLWLLLGFWFLVEENIVFGAKNAFTGLFCGFFIPMQDCFCCFFLVAVCLLRVS